MTEKELIDLQIRSEEVREILGRPPRWLIRWGVTVIFAIVMVVFVGSLFFKYPNKMACTAMIISVNPPASLIAHTNGKIDDLFVKSGQLVHQGDVLAILENTANYEDILSLKQKLDSFKVIFLHDDFSKLGMMAGNYSLGSLQIHFSNFQKQCSEFNNYLAINFSNKKIASIKQQIDDYGLYEKGLELQIINLERNVNLSQKQYRRDSSLFHTGAIASLDFEKSEQTFIQGRNNYHAAIASLNNAQMQIGQLKYQIIELQSQRADQSGNRLNSLKEAHDNLNSAIAEWEKTYLIQTPIEGIVTFTKYWSKNQFVVLGDIVFSVIPSKPHTIFGRIKFPLTGSGKVESGQKVQIKLENFPYIEYGILEGKIETISLIPEVGQQGTFYNAEVSLPNGLITNYKKKLPFNQQMQGIAEIITKDQTIFDRFFNPIKSAFKKTI